MVEGAIERAEQPKNNFEYFSMERTKYILESFGYGEKKMLLDAFHFNIDDKVGVGVLQATKERCEDHFTDIKVFRGVDIIEAAAQTRLILDKLLYDGEDKIPIFKRVKDFNFYFPVPLDSILNIIIDKKEDVKNDSGVISSAEIYLGNSLVSKGLIEGTLVNKEFFNKYLERESKKAAKAIPKFPIFY